MIFQIWCVVLLGHWYRAALFVQISLLANMILDVRLDFSAECLVVPRVPGTQNDALCSSNNFSISCGPATPHTTTKVPGARYRDRAQKKCVPGTWIPVQCIPGINFLPVVRTIPDQDTRASFTGLSKFDHQHTSSQHEHHNFAILCRTGTVQYLIHKCMGII